MMKVKEQASSNHISAGPVPVTWEEGNLASKVCALCDCLTWSRKNGAVRSIWHVSGLQAWQRHPEARLHGWGVAAENCSSPQEWQHQSQCQTEVEGVQIQKHDYCFELPTPRERTSTNVYSWLPSKKTQGQGVGESTITHTHTHYRVVNPCFHGLTLS